MRPANKVLSLCDFWRIINRLNHNIHQFTIHFFRACNPGQIEFKDFTIQYSRSWHNVTSEPLSRRALLYVSITLPPLLPQTLTGMIPRHTCVSPAPVAFPAPLSLKNLTPTSLGCNCCLGFTSLDPKFWFRYLVSLSFDPLLGTCSHRVSVH